MPSCISTLASVLLLSATSSANLNHFSVGTLANGKVGDTVARNGQVNAGWDTAPYRTYSTSADSSQAFYPFMHEATDPNTVFTVTSITAEAAHNFAGCKPAWKGGSAPPSLIAKPMINGTLPDPIEFEFNCLQAGQSKLNVRESQGLGCSVLSWYRRPCCERSLCIVHVCVVCHPGVL